MSSIQDAAHRLTVPSVSVSEIVDANVGCASDLWIHYETWTANLEKQCSPEDHAAIKVRVQKRAFDSPCEIYTFWGQVQSLWLLVV